MLAREPVERLAFACHGGVLPHLEPPPRLALGGDAVAQPHRAQLLPLQLGRLLVHRA